MIRYMDSILTRWKSQVRILYAPLVVSEFREVAGQGLGQGFRGGSLIGEPADAFLVRQ